MKSLKEVLIERDGITERQAQEIWDDLKEQIDNAISDGEGYDYIQDILMDEVGLEPDYLDEFLY
jgi:TPP-dependent pyruvate/acetoin dehydrogenase alpha subunit